MQRINLFKYRGRNRPDMLNILNDLMSQMRLLTSIFPYNLPVASPSHVCMRLAAGDRGSSYLCRTFGTPNSRLESLHTVSSKNRKWTDECVQHGFTWITGRDGSLRPGCRAKLSNSSQRVAELKEHVLKLHGDGEYKNTRLYVQIKTGSGGVRSLQ